MALIKCTECSKEISDKATTCPNCGNPIKEGPFESVVTIQQTYKKWKIIKLVSWVVLLIGAMTLSGSKELGSFLIFIAFIGLLVGKFGAWWTNK